MDIWIILDGEKTGPIPDFEVRRRISDGELPAITPAWHEGLEKWKPLAEIDLFSREFDLLAAPSEAGLPFIEKSSGSGAGTPPPLPRQTHYLRRFWARWFDLSLYTGVWWICMWAARQNIEAVLLNNWVMFLQYVPWFMLETILIQRFATTPGKWLLGLRVVNNDGSPLDLAASTRRSLRVMFTGIGFGWGVLALFCQALSIFTAKRLGTTLWDHTGGHRVEAAGLSPFRIVSFVIAFFLATQLHVIVLYPYAAKFAAERNPELKEVLEEMAPWHLPTRSSNR